jgi:hypothetical protein
VGDRGDRADDVHGVGVEVAARVERADGVGLDQRGVVDEHVGDAVALDERVEGGPDRRLVGHVGGAAQLGGAVERGERSVDRGPRPGDHADGQALAGEPPRHRGSDSGSRSDDDGSWHLHIVSRSRSPDGIESEVARPTFRS